MGYANGKVIDYERVRMACDLARANNMFVVPKQEPKIDDQLNRVLVPVYILYRNLPNGKTARLGRRRDPDELMQLVRRCAGLIPLKGIK